MTLLKAFEYSTMLPLFLFAVTMPLTINFRLYGNSLPSILYAQRYCQH
jgi:hypothetical protein